MRVQTVSQQHGDCSGCGFCTKRRKRIARIVAGGCRQHSAGESIHVGEGVASAPPAASRSSRTEYRSEHDVSRRHGQDTSTDVRQQLLHGLHLLQSLCSQVHVHMDTKPHGAICVAVLDYIITFSFAPHICNIRSCILTWLSNFMQQPVQWSDALRKPLLRGLPSSLLGQVPNGMLVYGSYEVCTHVRCKFVSGLCLRVFGKCCPRI